MEFPDVSIAVSELEHGLESAREKYPDASFEVYLVQRYISEVSMQVLDIHSLIQSMRMYVAVRAAVNKQIGFSYTTSSNDFDAIFDNAYKVAKISPKHDNFEGFPYSNKYSKVEGLIDPDITNFDADVLSEYAHWVIEGMRDVSFDVRIRGSLRIFTEVKRIFNSEGLDVENASTNEVLNAVMISNENDIVGGSVSDSYMGHKIEINFEKFGSDLARRATKNHQGKLIASFDGDIILVGDASAMFVKSISQAFNGEHVLTSRSPFSNKIDEAVFGSNISLISDGLYSGGFYSSPFDDEGCPTKMQYLVKNGVVKGFMTDLETAHGLGKTESTGNARREDPESPPKILPLNLILQEGDVELEEAISSIKKGIIIRRISGNGSFVTGTLSGIAKEAEIIQNGELVHSVRKTMIAGNMYDWLKSKITPLKGLMSRSYVVVPPILISNVKIVGEK